MARWEEGHWWNDEWNEGRWVMDYVTYNQLELNGRLGNQLWQIAWMFGAANALDAVPVIRPDWSYREFFSVPDEYFGKPPNDIVYAVQDGGTEYFQELHYFSEVAEDIRAYFQPSELMMGYIRGNWGHLTEKQWASVHVRRGDYLLNPHIFPPTTEKYYRAAIADVLERKPGISFAVFSDDIEWCKENFDFFGFPEGTDVNFVNPVVTPVEVVERVQTPQDQLDLFFMSLFCEEHIISNSTFAWWGAWLSHNRNVIYPSLWYGPSVPTYATHKLAFPASWREFDC